MISTTTKFRLLTPPGFRPCVGLTSTRTSSPSCACGEKWRGAKRRVLEGFVYGISTPTTNTSVKLTPSNLYSLHSAGLFYSTQTSFIEHKLVYDWVRSQIRVSFKITLVKSSSAGKSSHQEAMDAVLGTKASSRNDHTVVSGISEYFVDSEGKILKHVISNIIINDKPVTVGLGMGELFSLQRGKVAGVGASIGMIRSTAQASPATALKSYGFGGSSNRLEAQRNSALRSTFSRLFMTVSDSSFDDNFDELARQRKALEADLEKKNQARAKFNLKPMTMFEYEQLLDENAKVVDNFRSYQQQTEAANEPAESKRGEGAPAVVNLFSAVISAILPKNIDAPKMCTTFEDCDDGQECCDLLVAKVCCNSGLGSHAYMPELDLIPVRIDDEPDYNPGEQGRGVRGPWRMDEQ